MRGIFQTVLFFLSPELEQQHNLASHVEFTFVRKGAVREFVDGRLVVVGMKGR